MFLRLPPPEAVLAKHTAKINAVRSRFRSLRARLSERKRLKLERIVRRHVEEWERGTSGLRATLRARNDFYEGKPEGIDFPFGPEASSSIDVRLAAGYGRLLRAQFVRAVFADPAHTYLALPTPEVPREVLNQIERAINWTAENDCNLNEVLKDTWIPAYRDSTAMIHGRWDTRIERGYDYATYDSEESFREDYPDAKSAKLSEDEYEEAIGYLNSMPAQSVLRVEYQVDFVAKNGPTFSLCPLAKFIWGPLYLQDLPRLSVYGYHYQQSGAEFNQAAKDGYYDAEAVNVCRKRVGGWSFSGELDSWDEGRAALEGISSQNSEAVSYRLAWLAVKADLDEDGVDERYSIIYDLEKHRALRIEDYGLPRNTSCMVPFRLVRKDGRFLGGSMLGDAEPIYREINALHRHRSNTRRLTDSVTLLIPEGLKNSPNFDLGAEYSSFIPGRPLYVPDNYMTPHLRPAQLAIVGTSKTNESVDEEAFLQRYIDLLTGASPGQSGRESPVDPSAPASKTAMLLSRADLRVEDLIDEWRRTVPDSLDLLRALYQRNATGDIELVTSRGDELESQRVALGAFADPRVRAVLKPMKPAVAPEMGMQRYAALAQAALQFQLPIQAKPTILIDLWNGYVAESRIERPERFQIEMGAGGQMTMGGNTPVPPEMLQMVMAALMNRQADGGQAGDKKPGAGVKAGRERQAAPGGQAGGSGAGAPGFLSELAAALQRG